MLFRSPWFRWVQICPIVCSTMGKKDTINEGKPPQRSLPNWCKTKRLCLESCCVTLYICRSKVKPRKLWYADFESTSPLDEEFAASVLHASLNLLTHLVTLWAGLSSAAEIFHRLRHQLLPRLPLDQLHEDLRGKCQRLQRDMEVNIEPNVTRSHTVPQRKKEITILKLYDPELDDK